MQKCAMRKGCYGLVRVIYWATRLSILSRLVRDFSLALLLVPISPDNISASRQSDVRTEFEVDHAQSLSHPHRRDSMKLLQRLANEEVEAGDNFLSATRFTISRQTRTLFYDLSPTPLA